MNQTIFEFLYPKKIITKPIRLIELFSGYGSQALALKYLGVSFEYYKTCEWAFKSIQAYKDIHFPNDNTDYSADLTKEQITEYLFNKGISSNWNEPMKYEQIKKLGNLRKIYNNIILTHNLVNIQQVKGDDLEITETDKYEYIMTYSFPCQDLSSAGKRAGMKKCSSTRSGLLWEVERILDECKEKPQVLLMENVPDVIGKNNIRDFQDWELKLESMGYKNYIQCLNAKDYGIPQNRNRCFMVSLMGNYSYTFAKKVPLTIKLKDLLEKNVEEKYYLSSKELNGTLNTDFECTKLENRVEKNGVIPTICARDYKGPKLVIENNKALVETLEKNEIKEEDLSPILDTCIGNNQVRLTIDNYYANSKQELCDKLIKEKKNKRMRYYQSFLCKKSFKKWR